jgi:hypothetical protein
MEGQMTDEQINAAIAEACGWRKEDGVYMWIANGIDYTCPDLWDWANDLNAMHEAEAALTEDQLWIMARQIERNWEDQWYFRATARQRAEAFLRTLDKWEDSK